MTGWRIGYCGGPQELIEAMENVQSHSTSNPTSISQYAAEAALNGDQSCIDPMVQAFKERGAFVAEALNRIPGREVPAARRRVLRLSRLPRRRSSAWPPPASSRPPPTWRCATTSSSSPRRWRPFPGSAFGTEGYLRISFATSMENLKKAVERMAKAMA